MDASPPASDPPVAIAQQRSLAIRFGILLLLALVPVVVASPFPTQDGPSHIYAAGVIDAVLSGKQPFASLYEVDLSPNTNWLGGVLLYVFAQLFSLDVAERLLIVLFVTVFSLGWWRLARGPTGTVQSPIVLFGPFFATGITLNLGFYSYGVGFALLPWVWALASGSARSLVIAGVLAAVAWFGHVLPALFACVGLAVIGASAHTGGSRRRRLVLAAGSALPSGALCAYWALGRPPASVPATWLDPWTLLESLVTLRPLSSWVGLMEHLALVMAVVFAIGVAFGQLASRRPPSTTATAPAPLWPWWALSGITLVAYFALPEGGQGFWFVSERVGLYPWLALLPVAARFSPQSVAAGARVRKLLVTAVFTLGIIVCHAAYLSTALLVEGVERSMNIMSRTLGPSHTPALLLDFSQSEEARFRPYLHLLGRIGVRQEIVDAGSYEAHTDHFQIRLRPHHGFPSPEKIMAQPEGLTDHDLRNICAVVSISASPAWLRRLEGAGWRESPIGYDETSRTRVHHRLRPDCDPPSIYETSLTN